MKAFSALVAVVALVAEVSAHYVFPDLIVNGVQSSDWQFTRQTNNWQDLNPVTDVSTTDVRCYTSLESGTAPSTATVAAGSTVTFTIFGNPSNLYHDGVLNVYMAKAPTGTDVSKWDGSGTVWFKIKQIPAIADGVTITFPSTGLTTVDVTIPAQLPSGQYLLRVEQIALHVAMTFQGAQFYISCAQLSVTGGGTGTPGPLVAFPGAYTGMEPGILINIYFPIPTNYTQPGPPVWPAVGSSSGTPAPPTSTVKSTSTIASSTVKSTIASSTVKSTVVSSPASSPTSGTVAEWGQCGGTGYTGPTACVSPFICSELNPFFFQCVPATS